MKITKTITIACLCGYTASEVLARDTNINAVRGIPIVKTALAIIVVGVVAVRLLKPSQPLGESSKPPVNPAKPSVEPIAESTSQTSEGWKDQKEARSSEYFNRMADTWGTVYGQHCVSYGHREFRAAFRRAPQGQDPIKACERTRAIINGIKFEAPIACYYRGSEGVVASWHVGST
ncbi:hypothetical protein FRC08_014910, partial [Ceratobasidium sp. 394]